MPNPSLSLSEAGENLSSLPGDHYPFRPAALGLLSAAVPGLAHLILRQFRKGTLLLLIFVALLAAFWPFRALRYYSGFLGLYSTWIVLGLYASCSAFRLSRALNFVRSSKWWLVLLVPACLMVLSLTGAGLTRMAGFRSFTVPSTAMDPTIRQGDHIVADMHSYRSRSPRRFETIVFKRADIFYIKRVVAVGGDAVEGRDQVIFINGKKLDEPYVEHIGEAPEWANTFGPVFVPAGKFFVMGDNRDYSLDSRSDGYGLVEQESIVGKPLYVYSSDRTGKSIR